MAEAAVLDTSAFLTLTGEEAGADTVRELVRRALAGQAELHAAFVSLTEVEYITHQEEGVDVARRRLASIRALPIRWHHSDDAWCGAAAKIKAMHRLSFADAFVAALAQRLGAALVHKDPEFELLGGAVALRALPFKGEAGA
ncbi:MAG: hypothetical protein RLZZ15_3849 [Verrucomicrobiota bacterium]